MKPRELATVLAALRYWQSGVSGRHLAPLMEIATDSGAFESLSSVEIEELCEKINCGEPPRVLIVLEGGVVQDVIADAPVDPTVIEYDDMGMGGSEDTKPIPQNDEGDEVEQAFVSYPHCVVNPARITRRLSKLDDGEPVTDAERSNGPRR